MHVQTFWSLQISVLLYYTVIYVLTFLSDLTMNYKDIMKTAHH